MSLSNISLHLLNTSGDEYSTTSLGRLFQCMRTLPVTKAAQSAKVAMDHADDSSSSREKSKIQLSAQSSTSRHLLTDTSLT